MVSQFVLTKTNTFLQSISSFYWMLLFKVIDFKVKKLILKAILKSKVTTFWHTSEMIRKRIDIILLFKFQ